MDFEWDEVKNARNRIKHGVDFSIAHSFDWDHAVARLDDRRNYGEERFLSYGWAEDGKRYVIVFTIRNGAYRIISARRFGRRDERYYVTN